MDGERFQLELRAEGPGPPAHVRLKRWLKAALLAYGLRCVRAEQLPDVQAAPTPHDRPAGQSGSRPPA